MPYFEHSFRSHNLPGRDPAVSIFASPVMVVTLNRSWIPFIMGALEMLAQDEYWDNPDFAVPHIDNLIAGLGKDSFQSQFDQLDGIFRPNGCNASVAAVNGAVPTHFQIGFANGASLIVCQAAAAGQRGITVTMLDKDDSHTPSAQAITSFTIRNLAGSLPAEFSGNVHYLNPAQDVNFTNSNMTNLITNKVVRDFTITREAAGFWCLFNMQGPNQL